MASWYTNRYTNAAFWSFLAGSFLNLLQISVLTEAEGLWPCNEISMCRTIDRTSQRVAAKVTNKGGVGRCSTTVHVHIRTFRSLYSYRSPLPETETLLICQRPLDSAVWIGEIKYRRVRTSKFLMRFTRRSLPGTLVFFNRCCGPTVRTNLQLNLWWSTGIRTQNDRTKICSVTVTPCFNKTSTELFGWWKYNTITALNPTHIQFTTEGYATLFPSVRFVTTCYKPRSVSLVDL